ncbi:MAG: GNAT family N-acetyltransferase [Terriglobales bacterium]
MSERRNLTIPDQLQFRPFLEQDALTAASWRHPEPYSGYDLDPWEPEVLTSLLRPDYSYHAILRGEEMVGYFCVGADARVPGWAYDDTALDFGMGLRPDLTGQGKGAEYLQEVIAFIAQKWPQRAWRVTVAGWNQRAIRVCLRAGFRTAATFSSTRPEQGEYLVLVRN